MNERQTRYWEMLKLTISLNRPTHMIMFRYLIFMESIGEL